MDDRKPSPLLPGEKIELRTAGIAKAAVTDDEINERYVGGEVRIVTEQARYPLHTVTKMLESGDYELKPDFQRRHRWDVEKQSRLIESFIMNVPVPPIFLYEDKFSHYEVMDGQQRLSAIRDFYQDKYRLKGLEYWKELHGRTYSELPAQIKKGIDRRYLSSIILLKETAKDETDARRLKQLVFERINSGGVELDHQEARNAIYDGALNRLCLKLARNQKFCRTWGIPEEPAFGEEERATPAQRATLQANKLHQQMQDAELVLRFFAY